MYLLVLIWGIISTFLGIGPALIITLKKFGVDKRYWFSWLLGGGFWFLALLSRIFLLQMIAATPGLQDAYLIIAPFFAGLFETTFRVLLLYGLTKFTANTKEKVLMAGLGWGTGEAFYVHTIQIAAILIFPDYFADTITILDGFEWTLIFGGYERIITEVFHLMAMILVFYGMKNYLKIERSERFGKNIFTRDPKPTWIWVLIVVFLHFLYDYLLILLLYSVGLILLYMVGTVLVGILASYTTNRIKYYPLFPEEKNDKNIRKN